MSKRGGRAWDKPARPLRVQSFPVPNGVRVRIQRDPPSPFDPARSLTTISPAAARELARELQEHAAAVERMELERAELEQRRTGEREP